MSQEREQGQSPTPGFAVTVPGTLSKCLLTIPGRLPGLNEYTDACRTNPRAGARMKQEAQEAVMWQIRAQLRGPGAKFTKPVFLLFTFYERDRRRDRDNVSSFARKVIQDALVKCGTLHDDGWDYVTGHLDQFEVDKTNPRIVVRFIEQEVAPTCKQRRARNSKK